ncbi:hypothetical protein CPJCM30710_30300 [Clostridium polyendosporum]|uniref:Lipoprotein n=1 Tax=Clostridium polyendosporum TaxID=69208 RepID=A0A919S2P0_9CLOT|nr:hypothetical protein [Clostridium polyendosporum]GIM30364.1 hypothetical protein CPJCM30710_30300 [Clostridium polyendosporum]
MKKILVISLVVLSMSAFLTGCQKAKTDSINTNQNAAQSTTNNTIVQKEPNSTPQKQTNNTDKNNDSKDETKTTSQDIQYKNDKLGFSLTFPSDWKGKYRIQENDMSIFVYFSPKQKTDNSGSGLLFAIINKASKDFNENFFDTISDKKYFEAKGAIYFIGGPTDIGFNENNPEFSTYRKLKSEVPNVIKTIK